MLARRGRCGPCIALMTKKVDKTFHEREIWAVKKPPFLMGEVARGLSPEVPLRR